MHIKQSEQNYSGLFAIFNSLYPMSEELKSAIVQESKIISVKKKTKILQAGSCSDLIYFIIHGAARIYHLDKQGRETTAWLLVENELLISVYSFFTGQPSLEYIETLEDCMFIELRKGNLDQMYKQYLEFNFIGRKLTEFYYIRAEEQAQNLRMLTAKQRYDKLIAHNPSLINRIPLGHIASYLGISQETLSRIRKKG